MVDEQKLNLYGICIILHQRHVSEEFEVGKAEV